MEWKLENRLSELCADCKGTGTIWQQCKCSSERGCLPGDCMKGGVKYCACSCGAERYEADMVSTTNIIAPITREWRFFPADQYGTPEFLQLCTDQAKEQMAAGRLAIAAVLERYVDVTRLVKRTTDKLARAIKAESVEREMMK